MLSGFPDLSGGEAQVLACEVLRQPKSWVISHPEYVLARQQFTHLNLLRERILTGEPFPYVIGHWEFYGLQFFVSPAVLIPRPETELLVEHALSWLGKHHRARRVADVGTGSGCIAISIAKNHPGIHLIATDSSWEALQIARQNILQHHLESRIDPLLTSLLAPFHNSFDLICANLPYIPSSKLADLAVARHEPLMALDGGQDGLLWIETLLKMTRLVIQPGGLILLEIEAEQGEQALRLAEETAKSATVTLVKDLADKDRLVSIQF